MKGFIALVAIALIAAGFWFFNQTEQPAGRPGGFGPVLVVAEPAQIGSLVKSIEALGTARANESVTLTANLTDTIRRVNFEDGDFVQTGTVLVELTNEEEAAQLAEARANLDEARRQLRRLEDLDRQGIAATSDVDQARSSAAAAAARLDTVLARLEDRLIRAPFSGMLGFRNVSPGTLMMPGEAITTLDDISSIKLDFTVPETVLGQMIPGRRIFARSAATGNRRFEGEVRTVGSRVDPVTRAALVRAVIDNEEGLLRPGMLMTVQVIAEQREGLVVPERSLVQTGEYSIIYVVGEDRIATPRPVELGLRQSGQVEIVSGLQAGELVITEGVIKMRPGLQVRLAGEEADQQYAAGSDGTSGASASEDDDKDSGR